MKDRNIKLFYWHEMLFQFSDTMLILVLPIFIYKLFDSISAVFIFYFSLNIIYSIIFIPIFNTAMKLKNPKYFMALGMAFYVSALYIFGKTNPENLELIIPATIIFAFYISFYWMIRHWFFSVNSDYEKIGKQISVLGILRVAISFIAPIIAGALSFFVSFDITFTLGAVTGLLAIIPITFFHAPAHNEHYGYKKIRNILKKPELKAIRPAYFWEGMEGNFYGPAWLLAFTIFIGNILDLGLLAGFTAIATAFAIWLMGHWFDKRKRVKMLTKLTKLHFVTSFLFTTLFFFPVLIYVWILSIFNQLTASMHGTVVDSYLFAYSNKVHPVHFHLNREIHLIIGRLVGSGTMAIAFFFLPAEYLWASIGLGAFMLFGWLTVKRSDHLLH